MSSTMTVHVRYNSWYISLPSSAKQQCEMNKFCVVCRTGTMTLFFFKFYLKFIAVRVSFAIVLTEVNKVNDFRVSRDL